METLYTYLPQDRRQALSRGEMLPDRTDGSALFADISGFTLLTEKLTHELGPRRGVEELLSRINAVYAAMIAEIERYGGSVISFAGDAVTCWFEEEAGGVIPPSALRASTCALALQTAMLAFPQLILKVAVSTGRARRLVVGDPSKHQLDALAGATIARLSTAERLADGAEVLIDAQTAAALSAALTVHAWRTAENGERFAVIDALAPPSPPVAAHPVPVLDADRLRAWTLPAVYERELTGQGAFLAELRPVVAFFMRFIGIDYDADEQAGEKLNALIVQTQAILARYDGTLLQLTIGDKGSFLYAAFGAPRGHEDDARRAVKAALELRESARGIDGLAPVQIGLSQGTMRTGAYGGPTRRTYGVIGDEANLAARLMQAAAPGEILVSGRIQSAVAGGFTFGPGVLLRVKGKAEPILVFSLGGEKYQRIPAQLLQPQSPQMIGRAAELERLIQAAEQVLGGQAAAVVVYGDPGIGKSRLMLALREKMGDRLLWLNGQTDSILRQSFNPFIYLLETYFDLKPGQPLAEKRQAYLLRLQELAARPEVESAGLQVELGRAESFLAALLGLAQSDSLFAQLTDPKLRYENTLTALSTFLLALSAVRPLALNIEDGQWLDDASHELLSRLTRQTSGHPILLLITARCADDGSLPAFPLEEWPLTTLELRQLPVDDLRTLVMQQLGGALDETLYAFLEARSQGVPFFAQQMILYFLETGAIEQRGDVWQLCAEPHEIPATLNAMLIARLDRLSLEVKQTVQTAAVLGREFDVRLLAQMLHMDVTPNVAEAEQGQIWNALTEIRYLFKHALLRDAAYDMQLQARLRDLHHLALTAHEQLYAAELGIYYDDLAYHAAQSGDINKQREYFRLAGEAAQAQYRNDAALDYHARLIQLLERSEALVEIHLKRAAVFEVIGAWPEAEAADRSALALAEELQLPAAAGRCQQALGIMSRVRGNYEEALKWLGQARATWEALSDRVALGQTLVNIGKVHEAQGNYVEAQEYAGQGLALARATGDRAGAAYALNRLGVAAWRLGDHLRARQLNQESLDEYRSLDDKRGIAATLNDLAIAAWEQGDQAAARAAFADSLELARAIGDTSAVARGLTNLGRIAQLLEDYTTALPLVTESLALRRRLGDKAGMVDTLINQGSLFSAREEYDSSYAAYMESMTLSREIGSKFGVALSAYNLGVIAEKRTHYAEARSWHQEGLRQAHVMEDQRLVVYNLFGLGVVVLHEGAIHRAVRLLAAAEKLLSTISGRLDPKARHNFNQDIANVRVSLGEAAFNVQWAEGEKMTLVEAIEYALQS
ncbi:MAG: tetratricopeptide repeat protein [Chloroflexota bacterium]